jgi:hypothetical protein
MQFQQQTYVIHSLCSLVGLVVGHQWDWL